MAKRNNIRNETLQAAEAFEIYYALGKNRAVGPVAKKLCITTSKIAVWKNKLNWDEKVKERDDLIVKELKEKFEDRIANIRTKNTEMLMGMIEDIQEERPDGTTASKIKIQDVYQLERVVKMFEVSTGGVSDRTELQGDGFQLVIKNGGE